MYFIFVFYHILSNLQFLKVIIIIATPKNSYTNRFLIHIVFQIKINSMFIHLNIYISIQNTIYVKFLNIAILLQYPHKNYRSFLFTDYLYYYKIKIIIKQYKFKIFNLYYIYIIKIYLLIIKLFYFIIRRII
ncbi:Hypothetical protein SFBmNL_01281 [Candidatus Arthromitus sp. SFB-mouse-NL]|nr:Hypothetical protein SFBmNL_01281 [Candidatus Arthromitus sp. SFB-mouse-NL]